MVNSWFKILAVITILVIAIGGMIFWQRTKSGQTTTQTQTEESKISSTKSKMKLASSAFPDNGMIPAKYTCDGQNISPPLSISQVPETAVSLVLVVDDPDAPAGDWVHWTVWNIDPRTPEIAEGTVPTGGIEGMTDFGKTGWGGPCPPSGTHHYQFKVYALNVPLDLLPSAKKKDIEAAMEGHILDQTLLAGLYQRG